jgi:hypothetical protein
MLNDVLYALVAHLLQHDFYPPFLLIRTVPTMQHLLLVVFRIGVENWKILCPDWDCSSRFCLL